MSIWSNIVRGVAIGDAWGSPNEFQSITSLTRVNEQGPAMPKELEITDDTQMTLYLAAALDDSWGGTEDEVKAAIIDAYLIYAKDPDNNRAPGVTVMSSLGRLRTVENPVVNWAQATSKTSDGCGSVMRATPTAFLPKDLWVGVTAFAAALTHGTPNAVAAAILNVALVRDLIEGKVKAPGLTQRAYETARDAEKLGLTEMGTWLNGLNIDLGDGFDQLALTLSWTLKALPRLQAQPWAIDSDPSTVAGMGGGWRAHDCLIAAILAVDMFPGRPYMALRRSVTTDGDSDSVGAVTGGLLGALYPTAFTSLWRRELKGGDTVRDRIEDRYVAWIENEADDYPFTGTNPKGKNWVQKLADVALPGVFQ